MLDDDVCVRCASGKFHDGSAGSDIFVYMSINMTNGMEFMVSFNGAFVVLLYLWDSIGSNSQIRLLAHLVCISSFIPLIP